MELTITLSKEKQSALKQRASASGYTDVNKYIERLITTDLLAAKSFDEILAPARKAFQKSGLSEPEIDILFKEAREEVYQQKKAHQK